MTSAPAVMSLLFPSYKDSHEYSEPTQTLQDLFPTSKCLLTSIESFMPHKVAESQVQGDFSGAWLWRAMSVHITPRW